MRATPLASQTLGESGGSTPSCGRSTTPKFGMGFFGSSSRRDAGEDEEQAFQIRRGCIRPDPRRRKSSAVGSRKTPIWRARRGVARAAKEQPSLAGRCGSSCAHASSALHACRPPARQQRSNSQPRHVYASRDP